MRLTLTGAVITRNEEEATGNRDRARVTGLVRVYPVTPSGPVACCLFLSGLALGRSEADREMGAHDGVRAEVLHVAVDGADEATGE
jgi:hypothetical protein